MIGRKDAALDDEKEKEKLYDGHRRVTVGLSIREWGDGSLVEGR